MEASELPPGFRFHPTDEELIMYYLRNQATSRPCPVSMIPEVDIYKFDPWQLPEKSGFGEKEWYFFSPRDRKYPNGVRPNRAAVSGYWKATGTDKAIYSGSKYVGVKKALVFYTGRPPKGVKTDWIMHEYRLCDSRKQPSKHMGSMRLDDWVLCRIYKKKPMAKSLEQKEEDSLSLPAQIDPREQEHMSKFPRTCSITQLLDMDYLGPISQLLCDNSYNSTFDFQNTIGSEDKPKLGEMPYQYMMDSGKFQVNQGSILSQPIFLNPVYDMPGFDR
ncbi:NAC domain-containing protein 2-like [Alnus glutinosa]|uniref:NAC domain-containing protein 2-like n=1 Tax=Alnus glutinosa TaxID=3517 RepID=UPI002D79701F|nr:NAC domain-containing protein 2-like [Alnus glutinosa]